MASGRSHAQQGERKEERMTGKREKREPKGFTVRHLDTVSVLRHEGKPQS